MFALLQAVAALKYLQKFLTKSEFKMFFFLAASVAAGLVFLTVVGLTWLGVIAPWSGRLEKIFNKCLEGLTCKTGLIHWERQKLPTSNSQKRGSNVSLRYDARFCRSTD